MTDFLPSLKKAAIFIKDEFLFPTFCAVCGKKSESVICPECEQYLQTTKNCCVICSASLPENNGEGYLSNLCPDCQNQLPEFKHCSSVAAYNNISSRIIKDAKYRSNLVYLEYMAKLISEKTTIPADTSFITCIPMHKVELFFRNYDHNIMLAELVSKNTDIPFYSIFKKTSYKTNQAKIESSDPRRKTNIQNTFAVDSKWKGKLKNKTIVICDDVTTSGATLNELSKLLKEEGAVPWCVTFANARYKPERINMILL